MDEKIQARFVRLLRNSKRFMWGLYDDDWEDGRKERIYNEINRVFNNLDLKKHTTYDAATEHILSSLGIERIIDELVVPRIKDKYSSKILDELREKWNRGEKPQILFLKHYGLSQYFPFLDITFTSVLENVDGWSPFAIVWFEFIEPYLRTKQ